MTFNIRFGAGSEERAKPGYDVPSSRAKIRAVEKAVSSVAPDVVALQEVRDAAQAGRIARLLDMKTVYTRHPASYSLDFFEWGLAFLFRSERLHVDNPDLEDRTDGRNRRKMLAITLAGQRKRIDHIFVDLRYFTVENAGLVPKEHRQASDHIAYFADIRKDSGTE